MKIEIVFSKFFGPLCADGEKAYRFFNDIIVKELSMDNYISFNFANIKNMNSSFANAIFANMIIQYGGSVLNRIEFQNANENIKLLVRSALELGLRRREKGVEIGSGK